MTLFGRGYSRRDERTGNRGRPPVSLAPQGQLERKGANHEEDDSNQEHAHREGPVRGCVSAIALTGAAGIAAGQAEAAATQIKHPKLKDGVLSIEGSKRSDRIALRLRAGDRRAPARRR